MHLSETASANGYIFNQGKMYQVRCYAPGRPREEFAGTFAGYDSTTGLLHFSCRDFALPQPDAKYKYLVKPSDIMRVNLVREGECLIDFDNAKLEIPEAPSAVARDPSTEFDPSGLDANQPGAKLDAGKPLANDILAQFPNALEAVIQVGTFGANKYSLGGWIDVEDGVRRYKNAAARHKLYRDKGEEIDPDSGFPHEYHELWNHMAALELKLRGK